MIYYNILGLRNTDGIAGTFQEALSVVIVSEGPALYDAYDNHEEAGSWHDTTTTRSKTTTCTN